MPGWSRHVLLAPRVCPASWKLSDDGWGPCTQFNLFYFWWLLYFWDFALNPSLVVQVVKNLPEMQEIWVWSLGQEDPLDKEMATQLYYSCLENPMDRGAWQSIASQRVRHDWATNILGDLEKDSRKRSFHCILILSGSRGYFMIGYLNKSYIEEGKTSLRVKL